MNDTNGYCCNEPKVRFRWHLGAEDPDDPGSQRLMKLDAIECETCGAQYVFDTMDDTACPVRMSSADSLILAVKLKQVPLQ